VLAIKTLFTAPDKVEYQPNNQYASRMKKKPIKSYMAFFEEEEDGGYSVSVPALPGCYSQGDSFEEARANIAEAIELYLEDADEETLANLKTRRGEVVTSVTV